MNYLREIKLSELPNSYAGRIPAVRYLYEMGGLKFQKSVTLFVGENGTGKSTLLEAIAAAQVARLTDEELMETMRTLLNMKEE